MKKNFLKTSTLLGLLILFGCQNQEGQKNADFVREVTLAEKPSRNPHFGFEWEKISGVGIEFWAQKNEELHIGISETLPGAFVERIENGQPIAIGLVIQVFELKNQKIEDVLEFIQDQNDWDINEFCAFEKIESSRQGVERYVLRPTGKTLQEFKERSSIEPITHTCGLWGMGNSGIRYFEIHQNNRNKALFLEIGQEAPLFDEETIIVK